MRTGDSDAAGAEPAAMKTAVFETHGGEEGWATYENTVTMEYAGDVVYHVTDIMEENFVDMEEYKTRLEDYKSWEEAEDEGVKGFACKIDIGDNNLRSTVTVDMNKAKVGELYNVWTWWETDKDYLSYEEVRYHFVEESEFTVVEE